MSWLYLVLLSIRMADMGSPLSMPMTSQWSVADAALMWTMWAVMMAAMMLPSAAPMVSTYDKALRAERANLRGSTPLFVVGYLVAWASFAGVATFAQWVLHDAALVDAMGESQTGFLGGALLLGAGVYQFSRPKDICLKRCRSPLSFVMNEWRAGADGALIMGIRHGAFCVGCCWALMALLFVLGVMNLWWIALVASVVLLEKVVRSNALPRVLGIGLIVWGVALITGVA